MGPIISVFVFTEDQHYLIYAACLLCLAVFLNMIAWRYHQSVIKQDYDLAILQQGYLELKRSHNVLSHFLENKDIEEKVIRAVFIRIRN